MIRKVLRELRIKWVQVILAIAALVYAYAGADMAVSLYRNYRMPYFDLGTMYQPTYNTYQAFKTGDLTRILEMTDPHQHRGRISRLSYHFDPILILISLALFVYSGPETLLVFQALSMAAAVIPLYLITKEILKETKYQQAATLAVPLMFLIYHNNQTVLIDTYHPVTLAPVIFLFLYYFLLKKRYLLAVLFILLGLTLKENAALVIGIMLLGMLVQRTVTKERLTAKEIYYFLGTGLACLGFFYFTIDVLIPYFNKGPYHYLSFYGDDEITPLSKAMRILLHPYEIFSSVDIKQLNYWFGHTFGPFLFLPLLGVVYLIPAIPELFINFLSEPVYTKYPFLHYQLLITPFVFLALIYSLKLIITRFRSDKLFLLLLIMSFATNLLFSIFFSVLIQQRKYAEWFTESIFDPGGHIPDFTEWKQKLNDPSLRIAATEHLAPHFADRRVLYTAHDYARADYVLIMTDDFLKENIYETRLKDDRDYQIIFEKDRFKVYKKEIL